jgi:AcrR family transcriptional regulator
MAKESAAERLREAAFRLFEEQGYDATTVDHIAERAGVGRTTFFRTFGSKEDVIFPDHDSVLARIRARLLAATDENHVLAVSEAARIVLRHYLDEGDLARDRYRLTRSVPALRHREIASMQQYQREFREFIRTWMGGGDAAELRAELMAATVVTAHNHVLRRWLRGLTEEPEREFDAAMSGVVELFDDRSQAGSGTTVIVLDTPRDLESVLPLVRKALKS